MKTPRVEANPLDKLEDVSSKITIEGLTIELNSVRAELAREKSRREDVEQALISVKSAVSRL